MFGFKSKDQVVQLVTSTNQVDTLISKETAISGGISFSGSIKIAGEIQGNVIAVDMPKGSVITVEAGGLITGDLIAESVIINGQVNGNVYSRSLYFGSNAKIEGDFTVTYEVLQIDSGAVLDCRLCKGAKNIQQNETDAQAASSE